MIPLATSTGIGAGYDRATAGVIVGGQTLSLVLTLLVTPVTYSLFDDAVLAWRRLRALVHARRFATERVPHPEQGEEARGNSARWCTVAEGS